MFKDNQGSVLAIANSFGQVVQRMKFDPWGERVKVLSSHISDFSFSAYDLSFSEIIDFDNSRTSMGYTGHEMLDDVGLIHMGGRIYNPKIARFLQADPIVQAPNDFQNWNRYSYVLNNPTNLTDPSGYSFLRKVMWKIHGAITDAFPAILSITVAVVATMMGCPTCATLAEAAAASGVMNTMIAGGASALFASNGDIDQFWSGAASAFLFFHVGELAQAKGWAPGSIEKSIAHGVSGGVSSAASGGSFADGFIGSFVSQSFSPLAGDGVGGYVSSAMIGGTVSRLTGGDFANGAISAAYGHLFNDMKHPGCGRNSCDGPKLSGEYFNQDLAKAFATEVVLSVAPGGIFVRIGQAVHRFDSVAEAAQFVANNAGRKIPNCDLCGPPNKRGNAPIGNDGHPVELHHRNQKPDGPLDEMTRTDHRLGDNFKKNHSNTGQDPSQIDRKAWRKEQKDYWKQEWDSGRFDDM